MTFLSVPPSFYGTFLYRDQRAFPDSFTAKGASLVTQMVKNLPAMKETWHKPWVQSLHWEDPLKKEMANHSSILAWKIPWTEEPGGAMVHGSAKSWT